MQIGQHIELPGIRGAGDLIYDLPVFEEPRRVKIYMVPVELSEDRYFVSIKLQGGLQAVPPSRARDTILLVDFWQETETEVRVDYVHLEVENA